MISTFEVTTNHFTPVSTLTCNLSSKGTLLNTGIKARNIAEYFDLLLLRGNE